MSNSMADSIAARMADWSTNYLSTEYCVLSPGSSRSLRIPNSLRRAHRHLARGHASTAAMRTTATGGER